jgi:hypothetical protein
LAKLHSIAPTKSKTVMTAKFVLPQFPRVQMDSHEAHLFLIATEMTTAADHEGIVAVVRETQPDAVVDGTIPPVNYGILRQETLLKVRDFVAQCLTTRGLSYPE